jgi:hypothetical protein
MRRALVIVSVGPSLELPFTLPWAERYARRHQFELVLLRDFRIRKGPRFDRRKRGCFEKFQLHEQLTRFERLIYADADALLTPDCPNLLDLVPEDAIGAVADDLGAEAWKRQEEMEKAQAKLGRLDAWDGRYFNTGVLVLSACHREFLDPSRPMPGGRWPEQTGMNYWSARLGIPRMYLPSEYNLTAGNTADFAEADKRRRGRIIHYAGLPNRRFLPDDAAWLAMQTGKDRPPSAFPTTHHFAKYAAQPGGVGAYLRWRQTTHPEEVLIRWLDRPSNGPLDLAGGSETRLADLRARAAKVLSTISAPEWTLCHSGWGWDVVAGLQPQGAKVVMLHSDLPRLEPFVRWCSRGADGFIAVHPGLAEAVVQILGEAWRERVTWAPYPVSIPHCKRDTGPRQPIIGYCGRLISKQKRVERIAEVFAEARQQAPGCRLEILGAGPEEGLLRRLLEPFGDEVTWHGWQSGDERFANMGRWRHILFTSDYEGMPIAAIEAMAMGAVPIYPRLPREDNWLNRLPDPTLYPSGEPRAAAESIGHYHRSPELLEAAQAMLPELIRPHLDGSHDRVLAEFSDRLQHLPRLSARAAGPSRWMLWLPVWAYNRLYKRRSGA